MPALRRSLLAGLILCLAALTLVPHLASFRNFWADVRETWDRVRSPVADPGEAGAARAGSSPQNDAPASAEARRTVEPPTPAGQTATAPTGAEADPLMTELRRRAREDPQGAMDWLRTRFSGEDRLRGMLEVVAVWAARDAEQALLWLESNARGIARHETLQSGIALWTRQDPRAAATWIEGMATDGSKVTAAAALAENWAAVDPIAARDWVSGLEAGPVRQEATRALVQRWAAADPRAATVWALAEAEFNGDTRPLEIGVRQYAKTDPEAAGSFLRSLAAIRDVDALSEVYLAAMAEDDPRAAADWLGGVTVEDPLYSEVLATQLALTWSRSDSVATSSWLNALPPGPTRDAAIAGFAETMRRFEPEAALAWADQIEVPSQRRNVMLESFQAWSRERPRAAGAWLQATPLEPDLSRELSELLPDDTAPVDGVPAP